MAYYLFKYLRKKYKAGQAPTTDESYLLPEISPGQQHPHEVEEGLESRTPRNGVPQKTRTGLTAEENARIKAETARRRKYRWKMILGLILPNFLAAVDVTIVAPAVPIISSHFSKSLLSSTGPMLD